LLLKTVEEEDIMILKAVKERIGIENDKLEKTLRIFI